MNEQEVLEKIRGLLNPIEEKPADGDWFHKLESRVCGLEALQERVGQAISLDAPDRFPQDFGALQTRMVMLEKRLEDHEGCIQRIELKAEQRQDKTRPASLHRDALELIQTVVSKEGKDVSRRVGEICRWALEAMEEE